MRESSVCGKETEVVKEKKNKACMRENVGEGL